MLKFLCVQVLSLSVYCSMNCDGTDLSIWSKGLFLKIQSLLGALVRLETPPWWWQRVRLLRRWRSWRRGWCWSAWTCGRTTSGRKTRAPGSPRGPTGTRGRWSGAHFNSDSISCPTCWTWSPIHSSKCFFQQKKRCQRNSCWIGSLVPDVGDPEAGQEEDNDDKKGGVLEPQWEMGAANWLDYIQYLHRMTLLTLVVWVLGWVRFVLYLSSFASTCSLLFLCEE